MEEEENSLSPEEDFNERAFGMFFDYLLMGGFHPDFVAVSEQQEEKESESLLEE